MGPRELIAAACLLFTVAPAGVRAQQAADSPGVAPKLVEASEDVVVIGRLPRLPLPPSKVPASVQVIEAADLQRAARPSLPDALVGQVPGLSLADEQGNSYQPDLSLRGFQATSVTGVPQGVSVFLDGVRVNEPTAEEVNFDLLPTDDLDRVEVIPGPSVLFGRNTLAGAINLITLRGKEGVAAAAEASAGSAGLCKYRGRLSGQRGAVDFYLSGTATEADGWRQATGARLDKAFAKLGVRAGDNDLTLSYQHVDNRIFQAGSLPP